MKRFFLFLFVFYTTASVAQTRPVTLNGTLTMTTGETFPYKIVFTESNSVVNGYSLTYKAPDDTKTRIQGTLDRRNHTLTFKETDILYSHSIHTKAYMCLVDAKLNYTQGVKGNILMGKITSMEADNTSCTGGIITFSNDDEIQFLFAYHDQLDTIINMKRKVAPPAAAIASPTIPVDTPLVTDKVTTGIGKSYEWHSDTVVIDVWDGGNVDGDRVSILFNGKAVLTNYTLAKQKKQVKIPLPLEGTSSITIVAENEGYDPPNTASLLFTDGGIKYSVLAYNNKGQQSIIKIKRVKP